jgi:hypothetical protein
MSTKAPLQPRSSGSGSQAAQRIFSLADIKSKSDKPLPNRYGLYAGPGFGKTSIAAYAPKPIFLKSRGETGLDTLIDAGQIPPTPSLPEITHWLDLMAALRLLLDEEHGYKTLVIDTANGMERLCHEYITERDFGGDWGDRGFSSYQKGYDVSLAEWRLFQNELDKLREKGMTIFMLMHARVKPFRNPSGLDYDRYVPELHEKSWVMLKGWLDVIIFGNLEIAVHTAKKSDSLDPTKKGKASDASSRILYCNSDNPSYEAKNRLGLPAEIECGETPKEAWTNLAKAIIAGRKINPVQEVSNV